MRPPSQDPVDLDRWAERLRAVVPERWRAFSERYWPAGFVVFGLLCLYLAVPGRKPEDLGGAIDVSEVPKDSAPQGGGYVSDAERELERRKAMADEGILESGVAGAVQEPEKRGELPSSDERWVQRDAERRGKERTFLTQNRAEVALEIAKNDALARDYFKKYAKVREINEAFNRQNMPRFMALHDKYNKSDPFELWRQAFALPEFRAAVFKYAGDPEAMKLSLLMASDYLKSKPSYKMVKEGLLFAATDRQTSTALREQVYPKVLPRLPAALNTSPLPAAHKESISGLANLMTDGEYEGGGGRGRGKGWKAVNTKEWDDNMEKALGHGIDFYLGQQAGAKSVAEGDKSKYDQSLRDKVKKKL